MGDIVKCEYHGLLTIAVFISEDQFLVRAESLDWGRCTDAQFNALRDLDLKFAARDLSASISSWRLRNEARSTSSVLAQVTNK